MTFPVDLRPATQPRDVVCACGHPLLDHDPIATRFCAATISNGLPRGCICAALQ